MKIKIISLMAGVLLGFSAWGQDTAKAYAAGDTLLPVRKTTKPALPPAPTLHSDTRLGSSNPLYGTYRTNADGAGAITTNPHKTGGEIPYTLPLLPDTTRAMPVYRDTRLGSSSSLYNTYEKNKDGAGAVTTNPNKG